MRPAPSGGGASLVARPEEEVEPGVDRRRLGGRGSERGGGAAGRIGRQRRSAGREAEGMLVAAAEAPSPGLDLDVRLVLDQGPFLGQGRDLGTECLVRLAELIRLVGGVSRLADLA